MAKRRGLRVRITDDYVVNFTKASWFIELENWFWQQANKRFYRVTFEQWAKQLVKPFRPYVHIRFQKIKDLGLETSVSGTFTPTEDTTDTRPIRMLIHYCEWPNFDDSMRRRFLMLEFIKVLVHELNHQRQYRARKKFTADYTVPYFHDPDEIQCWALNATQSLIARYGLNKSRKIFWKLKDIGSNRYCPEQLVYAKMPEAVKKKFLKHVARYLGIYTDYYKGAQSTGVPHQLLKKSRIQPKAKSCSSTD